MSPCASGAGHWLSVSSLVAGLSLGQGMGPRQLAWQLAHGRCRDEPFGRSGGVWRGKHSVLGSDRPPSKHQVPPPSHPEGRSSVRAAGRPLPDLGVSSV